MNIEVKPLRWVGSAKKDLSAMPEVVQDTFGYALHLAQIGYTHSQAKVLRGFIGTSVLEIAEDYLGDAYRAIYTPRLLGAVYVLHCFQKKSKRGIQTPRQDIELVRQRLKAATEHAQKGTGDD
ncbi:MAG: type II toxin-antitoxin system RelE/ParE family toxin [Burkholderiaceae bacterium]|nr:type II toxin-antitoxin system RelE/ParE family toxin [Burkholderiaceae bacterium]MCD8515722.1 type II toxin-antitoxin system RelE/ParE family toxin [Burkholderiaceae bacterium]MCD8536098.1 type II toxin-antitoxin system RelE/ParE family toxin [Burkholderiaceae bacterium]MCD8564284.1 type II toxin-antitoxin system RelE/ParE family toxin [Burkholderiaceae bacterium]